MTANFKETQLNLMRPGQPVDIAIDAYPGRTFTAMSTASRPAAARLQPAAAGKRHRQFRQGGAARAGQDRVRRAARRLHRPRHVGRPHREGAMSDRGGGAVLDLAAPRPAGAIRGSSHRGLDRDLHAGARHLDRQRGARYIAGSMAASIDESTWVLTSYLIASAVVLPISGWLSGSSGASASTCCASPLSRQARSCARWRQISRAHLLPRAARSRRRWHGAERAVDAGRHVSAAAALPGLRALWRRRHRGADRRPDASAAG